MCAREEHQEPFSKEGQQAEEALELIHSDVCGRIPSSIQMCVAEYKIKEFKALIREPFCKED
jgi:hypothetical protein